MAERKRETSSRNFPRISQFLTQLPSISGPLISAFDLKQALQLFLNVIIRTLCSKHCVCLYCVCLYFVCLCCGMFRTPCDMFERDVRTCRMFEQSLRHVRTGCSNMSHVRTVVATCSNGMFEHVACSNNRCDMFERDVRTCRMFE